METKTCEISRYCQEQWPESGKHLRDSIKPYYSIRDELHVCDRMLFKGSRLIIPTIMRQEILNLIHEGHLDIDRCQRQSRSVVFWLNICNDIKNLIMQCKSCIKYRNANTVEPLLSHEPATLPWQKLGIDSFDYSNLKYLLIVDYFSKYFEVMVVSSAKLKEVIRSLKSTFARHGIPSVVITDNGSPFNSKEFQVLMKEWDISHHTSSPYFPESNGLVERSVGIIKKLFNKSLEAKTDPYIALLQYRNTPQKSGYSPAQLLMSRSLRTKLPVSGDTLKPERIDYTRYAKFVREKINKTKKYHDQHTKDLPLVDIGDNVYFKKTPQSHWLPASVIKSGPMSRSFVVKTPEGAEYRRNRQHIYKPNKTSEVELPHNRKTEILNLNNADDSQMSENRSVVTEFDDKISTRSGRRIRKPGRFTFTENDDSRC